VAFFLRERRAIGIGLPVRLQEICSREVPMKSFGIALSG
jgi:hypothetical protein